ncbi:unnamed protein product [Rotaria sp. Silwood2]|nr:unnamed protein product [Rotaria sp. Silwood2]
MGNGYGTDPDQLQFPDGLFIEPKTQILYVADVSNNRVQKRYPNGEIKTAAGQSNGAGGSTSDKLDGPRDIFADENENVFVVDEGNQRVQFWTKDAKSGKTVAGNGTRGSALNEFSYPFRLALDSKKNIFVADLQNQRITRWPSTYDPKKSVGTTVAGGNGAGLNPYQLYNPTGLYLDEPNHILYISNEESHSVIQWDMEPYGNRNIYAGIPGRPGNSPAQLSSPQGLILDKYGNLYITDCDNNRIQMFCPNAVYGEGKIKLIKRKRKIISLFKGHYEIVQLLIDQGANVWSCDMNESTPLHEASEHNRYRCVEILLHHHAPINQFDGKHNTPLHRASQYGHWKIVRLLLNYNADVRLTNCDGYNSLEVAILNNHQLTVHEFLNHKTWTKSLRNAQVQMMLNNNINSVYENLSTPLRKLIRYMPNEADEVFTRSMIEIGSSEDYSYKIIFNYEFLEDQFSIFKWKQSKYYFNKT